MDRAGPSGGGTVLRGGERDEDTGPVLEGRDRPERRWLLLFLGGGGRRRVEGPIAGLGPGPQHETSMVCEGLEVRAPPSLPCDRVRERDLESSTEAPDSEV
eukprot:g19250.t1